ncbi:hypothetical protein E4U40_005449 [Claviceps sp. LM458 group G5]|nr:hypothetical protein E4U40_005449 [Claviceps sp. LM458 group G5]
MRPSNPSKSPFQRTFFNFFVVNRFVVTQPIQHQQLITRYSDMTSNATGQSTLNGPHRPGEQRLTQADAGPDYRRCINCGSNSKTSGPSEGHVMSCGPQQRGSGTMRAVGQVDGPTPQPRVARYQHIAPRTVAADYDQHGSLVFHPRSVRQDDTPAMQRARRDRVAISRAHRAQARDDLQPSPSQTPPLPDIMRGWQELEALHRRNEEELLYMGQRQGRAVSPSSSSSSSPFKESSSLRHYHSSSQESHPEPAFPQSSHPSTLPPFPIPDADVPYIEGTTTLDDLAITDTDIDCIERWRENLDKNEQERCDRCNCFWFDLDVVSGICKRCREADTIRRNPVRGQRSQM